MKPKFSDWAKQAQATILGVPRGMWSKFGIRRMPTLKAYKGKKFCGAPGKSGSSFKSKLDSCPGS